MKYYIKAFCTNLVENEIIFHGVAPVFVLGLYHPENVITYYGVLYQFLF